MKYSFLAGALFFSILSLAQGNKVVLTGTITMQTGEKFPYRIVGTEQNGVLKGFAYTYAEPDETKAEIEGQIDRQKRKLSFREVSIVSSHDVHTKAFMCLVHAKLENKNSSLTGPATSKELDNTACTEGVITFSNSGEVNELFSNHDKYDMEVTMGNKPAREPEKATSTEPTIEEPVKTEKITAGTQTSYEWQTDSIIINLWDGGNLDGDKVTISFDDVPVLKKYTIQKTKKRVAVYLPPTGSHTLSVYAEDEGSDPPNTASLTLHDGSVVHSLIAYNPKGAQSIISVRRAATKGK